MKNSLCTALLLSLLGAAGTAMAAAPQATPAAAAPAASFDVKKVPISTVKLPDFPLITAPPSRNKIKDKISEFDVAYVIAGNELRAVEGRVARRVFLNHAADLSQAASQRNHEAAIKALGGVKVNLTTAHDKAWSATHGSRARVVKQLGFTNSTALYDAYLVRTASTNIWFGVAVDESRTHLTVIEEQPMQQSVGLVRASAMRDALNRDGHIALYLNFDTDKATIRADGKPAVDEIVALLNNDPALKLSIEGHTDNSGDAGRNNTLSQQRADAVMAAVVGAGIKASRLAAAGYGSARPLADNGTEEGRARNRRVELVKAGSKR